MWVIPPFSEHCEHISHHGATQFEGCIVPRGSFPVPGIHGHRLRVSGVIGIVSTAVAKVDPANERDVPRGVVTMADDEEFLVMGAEQAYSLIQQHLSAGFVDLTT
ncbi:hypothetical protein [Arthrobacter sp. ok362]|uniref:hypothetical protein n=1 Tax=Arthrobacter sp. ok362 TaxID=1761745 RepID=UPI0034A39690